MLSNLSVILLGALLNVGGIIGGTAAGLAVGAAAGIFIWQVIQKKRAGNAQTNAVKLLKDAEQEVRKMRDDARDEAKKLRQEVLFEAKEEQHRLRSEFERESKERRAEIKKSEDRILQREQQLDKKESILDGKLEAIEHQKTGLLKREEALSVTEAEVAKAKDKMLEELQKVAQLSKEEAKQILIDEMKEEARRDAAVIAKEIEADAKENASKIAKNIIGQAIQRTAADHAGEMTVSIVTIPGDEMKGRLIGRQGRNIRAIENATGVDLIVDDTPDVITLSAFDPVRREIARISVEKLVSDGRIHPARIEEVVEKVRKEMDNHIKETGDNAVYEAGVYGIHAELIRYLGKLNYRTSYGQNVLNHSLEVSYLAGIMASELGANVKIAKRAGLLHDIGKAVDHEVEGTHISIGVELAKKFKESNEVIHAIAAHHGDVQAQTLEAVLVQAADAISGSRPGARRESLENYVKRLEKLEEIANSFAGVDTSFAIQAGREIRVIVKPEKVNDEGTAFLAKDIAKKLEAELTYPGQIKVNVIRETRAEAVAK